MLISILKMKLQEPQWRIETKLTITEQGALRIR